MPPPTVNGILIARATSVHEAHQRFTFFNRGRNIEENEFIGALPRIFSRQLHRVTGIAQVHEISALYGATVFDIEAGYDAFCKHMQFGVCSLSLKFFEDRCSHTRATTNSKL
jgi:hypothetical protein